MVPTEWHGAASRFIAAGLSLTLLVSSVQGQDTTSHKPLIGAPSFSLLPGGLTTCAISCDTGDSNTDFNARFQTLIPTATPWLAFVAGLQWGWADTSAHGPIGFFGGIVPIVPLNKLMDGWVSLSIDPLGVTTGPGGKGTNFVLEGAATLNLGAKMMKTVPFLGGFGAYFLVDQQLSRVARDANGDKDYWNPALVWGAFFQVAPWP
jgi:hypothetical protein